MKTGTLKKLIGWLIKAYVRLPSGELDYLGSGESLPPPLTATEGSRAGQRGSAAPGAIPRRSKPGPPLLRDISPHLSIPHRGLRNSVI